MRSKPPHNIRSRAAAALGRAPRALTAFAALSLALAVGGCPPKPKHYQLTGVVISKSVDTQQIVVAHDNIPGFMAAMTMPYAVRDPHGLGEVQPGDRIGRASCRERVSDTV